MILKKNEYLTGLEKIYQKYGISQVYGLYPACDVRHNNSFYCSDEISVEAMEELMLYSSADDDSIDGQYGLKYLGDLDELIPLYVDGTFYGEVT